MRPNFNSYIINKDCPRWLYEVLRRLESQSFSSNHQLSAIERGEAPSSGGGSLISVTDHGALSGLVPDDDHTQYALLRGRVGGQILNGSIDLSTTSSSYPWSDSGNIFISAADTTAGTSWNRLISLNADINNVIILSLATHSPGAGYGAGSTNYHQSIIDSKSNSWQKLGEFTTSFFAGVDEQTVSLWLCLVTSAMTTLGSDTITITFANSFAMKAIESRQFLMTSGLSFIVAGTATGGLSDSDPPSLSLSGLTSREYLFIRACGIHASDDAHTQEYTASTNYTAFTTDHSNSTTLASVGGNRGVGARGEFRVLTATGDTTDPTVNPVTFPDDASLMVAVYLNSTSAVGDLTLESILHTNAAKITLHNSTITMNADFINFQDKGGVVTNSYIRGTDGAFVGPIYPTILEVIDSGFKIFGSSDATKKVQFEVDGLTTATTRTLTVPDVSATLILSSGPANTAQQIGTFLPGGTDNSDDIAISGRLMIATSGNWTADQKLRATATFTGTTTINGSQLTAAVNTSGGVGSPFYRALLCQITGGSLITSGSPSFYGASLSASPSFGTGVSIVEVIGLDMTSTATTTGTTTIGVVAGLKGSARGQSNVGDVFNYSAIEAIRGIVSGGAGKVIEASGISLYMDATNKTFGYIGTLKGINLDFFTDTSGVHLGSAAYSCTVTNTSNILTNVTNAASVMTGQYITGTGIPASTYVSSINVGALTVTMNNSATANGVSVTIWGTVNVWSGIYRDVALPIGEVKMGRFLDLRADIPSQHYGYLYLRPPTPSSYPTATAYLHIGAGTAAATTAPIKLTSGTNLTTAEAGAVEFTTDDLFFTITTGAARKGFIFSDGTNLTAGRIPFATTNGRLTDDADFTFATDTLTITKIASTQFTGNITLADTINIILNATTGTKIATATSQKLGFWNTAPIIQPTTAIAAATFVTNTSLIADDSATFDGYTIGQVVRALRNIGILA